MKQFCKKILLLLVLISTFTFQSQAEKYSENDSIQVSKIVSDFFDWYLTAIKERKVGEYSPRFVESESGMTTLDGSMYFDNLKRLHFSETLLEKEKQSYQECIDNLSKVEYSNFRIEFDDLDDYELTNCDFNNYYRWIGLLEPIDGIEIRKLQFDNNEIVNVLLEYFFYDEKENKAFYGGRNMVKLKRTNNQWEIVDINLK